MLLITLSWLWCRLTYVKLKGDIRRVLILVQSNQKLKCFMTQAFETQEPALLWPKALLYPKHCRRVQIWRLLMFSSFLRKTRVFSRQNHYNSSLNYTSLHFSFIIRSTMSESVNLHDTQNLCQLFFYHLINSIQQIEIAKFSFQHARIVTDCGWISSPELDYFISKYCNVFHDLKVD